MVGWLSLAHLIVPACHGEGEASAWEHRDVSHHPQPPLTPTEEAERVPAESPARQRQRAGTATPSAVQSIVTNPGEFTASDTAAAALYLRPVTETCGSDLPSPHTNYGMGE